MGERDRGRRAGDTGQIVVLGHPEAPTAERLDMPGQIERVTQRLAGVAALGNRREVENGKRYHAAMIISAGAPVAAGENWPRQDSGDACASSALAAVVSVEIVARLAARFPLLRKGGAGYLEGGCNRG